MTTYKIYKVKSKPKKIVKFPSCLGIYPDCPKEIGKSCLLCFHYIEFMRTHKELFKAFRELEEKTGGK